LKRAALRAACSWRASAAATSASARRSAAWNGAGSIVYSDWPFSTRPPSLKLREIRMPVTRARTSTSREPAVWPTYSKLTGTARSSTVIALTSGGGMPAPGPPWPFPPLSWPSDCPQAASTSAAPISRKCLKRMAIVPGCCDAERAGIVRLALDTFVSPWLPL
jgi:hypothetical protein